MVRWLAPPALHHVPSRSITFHHVPSRSIAFHHVPMHSTHSITFHHIPSHSIIPNMFQCIPLIPSRSITFHCIPLIPSLPSHSIYSITFPSIPHVPPRSIYSITFQKMTAALRLSTVEEAFKSPLWDRNFKRQWVQRFKIVFHENTASSKTTTRRWNDYQHIVKKIYEETQNPYLILYCIHSLPVTDFRDGVSSLIELNLKKPIVFNIRSDILEHFTSVAKSGGFEDDVLSKTIIGQLKRKSTLDFLIGRIFIKYRTPFGP
jgi:hypothetical protein